MNKLTNCNWPQVFIDGTFDYKEELEAISDAYSGLGNISMGCQIPPNFGNGMEHISDYLGIIVTPENLDILFKSLMS